MLGRTTALIFDHASKIEHVLEKLRNQQSFPMLVQFWTPKILNGRYSLKTQNSQFFSMSSDLDINCGEDSCFLGEVFIHQMPKVWSDHALASLCLLICVGILVIVSKTKGICLQFFEEGRVSELFQKIRVATVGLICLAVGLEPLGMQVSSLICLAVGLEPLGMQLHVSTQGSEVPSNFLVDHTGQFTTGQVFNSKNELINWVHDVAKSYGFGVAIKSSTYDERPRIYLVFKSGTKKNEKWSLKVIEGLHNHPLAEHHEG
ncbi:hypothetical protein CsSME_00021513 [Camellia sinensis var. sinensis]